MAKKEEAAQAAEETTPQSSFDIRKIYLSDASVEAPNSPDVFLSDGTAPDIEIDASIKTKSLKQEDYYEVTLSITVTSKIDDLVAFLVEVHQSGIFHVAGISEEDMPLALQIAAPNVLLPFAREAICDLIGKAGFPQLLLTPINFESLYRQKLQAIKERENDKSH